MTENDFINQVDMVLSENNNHEHANAMKKYLRDQFDFYGIKAPLLKSLTKPFLQKSVRPDVEEIPRIVSGLWALPQREAQYFAIELLKKYHKLEPKDWIDLYEKIIIEKSWWDTVDAIAAWHVGHYFKRFREQITPVTNKWMSSNNIW